MCRNWSSEMEEDKSGYSDLFYLMLVIGIIGVVGFVLVYASVP